MESKLVWLMYRRHVDNRIRVAILPMNPRMVVAVDLDVWTGVT